MARHWLFVVLTAVTLTCASCTNLKLSKYRDDALLDRYHYALGEQYTRADNLTFCYQEMGRGPTVLILPGLGTSIDFWQLNIPELAKDHHVVAVDLPGFGKSDKPDAGYELTWLRDRIVAFLDSRGIERATIIGGSMGGHLALLIARPYPRRVDRLVLMGASGDWPLPGPIMDVSIKLFWHDAIVADYMRSNWPAIHGKIFKHQTPLTRRWLAYHMALRADAERYAPEGRSASRALRSILYTSCRGQMERIDIPALLVWGESDPIHTPADAMYFRRHLPRCRLVVVPDASHEVMVDQPEVFNDLVREFLRSGVEKIKDRIPPALLAKGDESIRAAAKNP